MSDGGFECEEGEKEEGEGIAEETEARERKGGRGRRKREGEGKRGRKSLVGYKLMGKKIKCEGGGNDIKTFGRFSR